MNDGASTSRADSGFDFDDYDAEFEDEYAAAHLGQIPEEDEPPDEEEDEFASEDDEPEQDCDADGDSQGSEDLGVEEPPEAADDDDEDEDEEDEEPEEEIPDDVPLADLAQMWEQNLEVSQFTLNFYIKKLYSPFFPGCACGEGPRLRE